MIKLMPYRRTVFARGEIYHILNRGIAQVPVFLSKRDYWRFLSLVDFYRYSSPPSCFSHYESLPSEEKKVFYEQMEKTCPLLAEIYSYCLIPNHFHFIMRQAFENGISTMLSNIQNGYAKFFNLKNRRQGALFQSMFKAIRIETDKQLLHVSRYIHLNPSSSFIVKIEDLDSYAWSSFLEYIGKRSPTFVNLELILNLAGGKEKYRKFVFDQAEYQQKFNIIKHLSLENP